MNVGDKAPEVLGVNEKGERILLSNYRGKKVVLYFYPKDNTSGCTAEACSLRDNYSALKSKGYEVIGVSVDSAASHKKFIEKHELPFTLMPIRKSRWSMRWAYGERRACMAASIWELSVPPLSLMKKEWLRRSSLRKKSRPRRTVNNCLRCRWHSRSYGRPSIYLLYIGRPFF